MRIERHNCWQFVTSARLRQLFVAALIAVLPLSLAPPPPALAATPIYVRPAGDDTQCDGTADVDYSPAAAPQCAVATIERGLTLVDPDGTVQVASGTYAPAGGRLVIDKSVTLQADPAAVTRPRINTNHAGWTTCAIQIAADNVVLDGFEVDNSAAGTLRGYIVGDYNSARNGWAVRNCDIHDGRNAIRPVGDHVTIEHNNLHETKSDLINCEYGNCFGLKVKHNWLHSHHSDLGGKPAGLTYTCSSGAGADVEITHNYVWACRTFIDFQNSGGLSPANTILVAHNTVDYWIGDLPDPIVGNENAQQMSIAWWSSGGSWNGPNFDIRDNLFTRQKWYPVVDTDSNLSGQITLRNNLFWQWYLNDIWYPTYAYPNEWPAARGAVGWDDMGPGNEFVISECITGDPLYAATGTTPDEYYALRAGSPAINAASDGTNLGAYQGGSTVITLHTFSATAPNAVLPALGLLLAAMAGAAICCTRRRQPFSGITHTVTQWSSPPRQP